MAESPYVYMLIGVMGIIIVGHWFPSIKNMNANSLKGNSLEQIQGIDLESLNICRQNGLM